MQALPYNCVTLSDPDRDRLAGILGRLASPFDGERAAAGLLATRFLAARGVQWADLLRPRLPAPDRREDWWALANSLLTDHADRLTDWEAGFLENLVRRFDRLSAKQRAVLDRLARKCGVAP